jgi:hypothetical protein
VIASSELARLTNDLDGGSEPSSLQRMPIPPKFWYPGRWLKGTSCKALTRLEVDGEGNVRCCRNATPLGKVGDPKEKLAECLSSLMRAAERRRGCDQCTAAECPRCPFPGLDDRTYCGTIRNCAPAIRTLHWIRVYSMLPSIVARQRDRHVAE